MDSCTQTDQASAPKSRSAKTEWNFSVEDREHERLKEEVKEMITVENCGWMKLLDLVDAIYRLGLSHLFEKEIESLAPATLKEFEQDASDVLHVVALRFQLLRQLGHHVSADVFNKFKDVEGNFKASELTDVRGLVSFFEASHYRLHDENVLDEALIFTTSQLQSLLPNLDDFFTRLVKHSLELPIQKTLPRTGAKQFISLYEADESHNPVLLKFAKLDNDMLQRLHPKEISSLTLWDISTIKLFRQILATYLIWAWHFILSHFRKPDQSPSAVVTEKTSHDSCREEERNELCSICLVKFDDQEHEVKELINCGHKFHHVCLDGWISHGEISCPLCRRYLQQLPLTEKVQVQPLLLKFCSLGTSHRGSDAWWLR